MQTILLSYAVQAFHADGRKGVCSTFGDESSARNEAKRLVAECGYERCDVETWDGCAACNGAGRLAKKRGKKIVPFAYITCKACKGRGMWQTACVRAASRGIDATVSRFDYFVALAIQAVAFANRQPLMAVITSVYDVIPSPGFSWFDFQKAVVGQMWTGRGPSIEHMSAVAA